MIVALWCALCTVFVSASDNSLSGTEAKLTSAVSDNERWLILEPNYGFGINENTIYKHGKGLKINFHAGFGDKEGQGSFGFQPMSSYTFEKLFKATSNRDKLDLWISVEGSLKDLDWVKVYSDNGWNKDMDPRKKAMTLNKGETFYISVNFIDIPVNAEIGEYMGKITFMTEMPEEQTPTDSDDETAKDEPSEEETDGADTPKTGVGGIAIYVLLMIFTFCIIRKELEKSSIISPEKHNYFR